MDIEINVNKEFIPDTSFLDAKRYPLFFKGFSLKHLIALGAHDKSVESQH